MGSKTDNTAQKSTSRRQPNRRAITFELVAAHAPNQGLAENLARTFGLDAVDYTAIRESTEEHVALSTRALEPTLSERCICSGSSAPRTERRCPTAPKSTRHAT